MHSLTREISWRPCFKTTAYLLLVFLPALSGFATGLAHGLPKDAPVTAIMLFDGPNGPGYIQITGVTLNAKTELRVCNVAARIDKRSYDLMSRAQLRVGISLERRLD